MDDGHMLLLLLLGTFTDNNLVTHLQEGTKEVVDAESLPWSRAHGHAG